MDGLMYSPVLRHGAPEAARASLGKTQYPSVVGVAGNPQGDRLLNSMDASNNTNTGKLHASGVASGAAMAARSPRSTAGWSQPQRRLVASAMPTTPRGKSRPILVAPAVHMTPSPFPGAAAAFTHHLSQEQVPPQAQQQHQHQQQQQQQQQQQAHGPMPPPPVGTMPPPPAPSSPTAGTDGERLATTPRSTSMRRGASQKAAEDDKAEDGAGRRTPPPMRLPGMDFLVKLGERVQYLEEQLKCGEEPSQQQAALRESVLEKVKSTSLEALRHSFSQQSVNLQEQLANLQDNVLSSLERGMREAERRLQGQVEEMCAQANRGGTAAEDADGVGLKELQEMLETERQDRSDLAEKQSDVLHGIIQEFTAFKESAESSSQELAQLRAE
ncbi:unnamed protein product, partial [Prorocentrum cordatum]